jgi:hypothetical protein
MFRKMFFFVVAALLVLPSAMIISARQPVVSNHKTFTVINLTTDLTGKWNVTAVNDGQEIPVIFEFKQEGEEFTGKISSAVGGGDVTGGKIKDDELTGVVNIDIQGQSIQLKLEAKVDGTKIKGTLTSDATGSVPFSGAKAE